MFVKEHVRYYRKVGGCLALYHQRKERNMITKIDIDEMRRKLYEEDDMWEITSDKDKIGLLYYRQGIEDMATMIIKLIDEREKNG